MLQKLLFDIFALNVAEISVNLAYEYASTAPPPLHEPTCSIHDEQTALYANPPTPGYAIAGWSLLSGGSCEALIQFTTIPYNTYLGFDAQGNPLQSANMDLCNVPLNSPTVCTASDIYDQEFGDSYAVTKRIAEVSSGTFFNNSSNIFFDCASSGGITISMPYVYVNALPYDDYDYGYSVSITGGEDGPVLACRSNLALITAATKNIGVPFD